MRVVSLTIVDSDNGLAPIKCWTNAGALLIRPLGTNFNEILNKMHTFSFKKMHLKMYVKRWQFCPSLMVLNCPSEWDDKGVHITPVVWKKMFTCLECCDIWRAWWYVLRQTLHLLLKWSQFRGKNYHPHYIHINNFEMIWSTEQCTILIEITVDVKGHYYKHGTHRLLSK